jgi:hypothetical protein
MTKVGSTGDKRHSKYNKKPSQKDFTSHIYVDSRFIDDIVNNFL